MRSKSRGLAALAGALAASLPLVSCGAEPTRHAQVPATRVSERDFSISVPKRLSAGTHVLTVHNRGPVDHELIVVRAGGRQLPFRRDGLTVNEDAVETTTAGTLEPGPPGATRALRVSLRPGRYEFFCNMSGHYLGGMHKVVVVR
jgi:uncharacterized cupredoxin-like copper-binding protein